MFYHLNWGLLYLLLHVATLLRLKEALKFILNLNICSHNSVFFKTLFPFKTSQSWTRSTEKWFYHPLWRKISYLKIWKKNPAPKYLLNYVMRIKLYHVLNDFFHRDRDSESKWKKDQWCPSCRVLHESLFWFVLY